jgi:hypothetical protein
MATLIDSIAVKHFQNLIVYSLKLCSQMRSSPKSNVEANTGRVMIKRQ